MVNSNARDDNKSVEKEIKKNHQKGRALMSLFTEKDLNFWYIVYYILISSYKPYYLISKNIFSWV